MLAPFPQDLDHSHIRAMDSEDERLIEARDGDDFRIQDPSKYSPV